MWWQHGVIYQIYPRSFRDTNGDGVGDLRGILQKLDYLAWLGVDALWISPIFPSPMRDFGYDVANYTDIDPLFGDLATFDELVREAHARELRVLLDYVPNHTSDQHPWFVASRSSRTDPKRDWYVWRDRPNNWLSVFGGPAWTRDEATGQYYLHSFLKEQPDLNWRNPDVRAAMLDVLRFWLARGVDGFRIDVAHAVMKDPELRDNPPNLDTTQLHRSLGPYDAQLHIHDRAHPDVHGVFRDFRRVLDEAARSDGCPRVSIGETHVFDWSEWARYYGAELDELHMPFNFGLLKAPWLGRAIRKLVTDVEAALPAGAWPNWVMGNHDEPRIASRLGPVQARVAMMLLLALRGTPTLYYGDELGMEDVPIPPEREQDPWGKLTPGLGLGRDPARTPMPWDDSDGAGFTTPGVEPWLPLAADHRARNVAVQQRDPRSLLSLTRALLALRRAEPALHAGAIELVDGIADDVLVFVRGASLLVALSFSDEARAVPARGAILASTEMDRDRERVSGSLALRPHEGCIVALDAYGAISAV